jgi:poly(3-hydroxybutyrate) depolymerase
VTSRICCPGCDSTWFGFEASAALCIHFLDRTYHFADTSEQLPYCVYVSSKVTADTPAPLIISLHGLGAPPQVMCNTTAVDLAEEGGYILAAPKRSVHCTRRAFRS